MITYLPLPHKCKIYSLGDHNAFGERVFSPAKDQKCHVLRAVDSREKTTVRADSSGTRGHAEENLADLWMLMRPTIKLKLDDRVVVLGMSFRIDSIRPRYTIMGEFDHFEVTGSIEQD